MPTYATFTEAPRVSDVLKWYVEERFCFATYQIKNDSGVAIAQGGIVPGTPLALANGVMETIESGEEATVDAIFIDDRTVPAIAIAGTTVKQYRVLVRGPALVNKDALLAADFNGATAYTLADLVTQLATLDIQVLAEPATKETQTT